MNLLAGIGYRRRYHDALMALPPNPNGVLEVMASHFFSEPESVLPLAEKFPIVIHDVFGSFGTQQSSAIDAVLLEKFRDIVTRTKPIFFTEHLAMTRSPAGIDLGHLCPLWLTHETLELMTARIQRIQDALGVPVLLENIAWPFVVPHGDFEEGPFFHELTRRTGAGLLLDVSNLLANAKNFRFDPIELLSSYPLHCVREVHLAGAFLSEGFWVDSHDRNVSEESFQLLEKLADRAPLEAIIVERDGALPPLAELLGEAERARDQFLRARTDRGPNDLVRHLPRPASLNVQPMSMIAKGR